MTSSNIPDSFSMDELSNMLENAPQEDELHASQEEDDKFTEEFMEKAANEGLDLMTDSCKDPAVHKLAVLKVCHNMIVWHTHVGEAAFAVETLAAAHAWLRDAGKWQSMMDIVSNISLGDNDHWCDHD